MLTTGVSTSTDQRTLALRSDIQGIRAISLILIVFFHAQLAPFHGGFVGPDVFFVLSGFLISTHLMQGIAKTGGVQFAQFYARRARRLVPTALFVVVLTVIGALFWAPPLQLLDTFKAAIATTLYVPNMLFAYDKMDYLGDSTPSLFLHYWTLGVEEQFYIVWPLLLFALFKFVKSTRLRVASIVAMTLISFGICVFLTQFFQPWAFFTLPSRAWAFGVGALIAYALLHGWRLKPIAAAIAAWIGLISLLVASVTLPSETAYPGYLAAIPIFATALMVVGGATPSAAGPFALLSVKPLTFLGDVSYSVYLVHWPLLQFPLAAHGYIEPLPVWERILLAAACVPVGWLIYKFIERPGRQAAWLAKAPPRKTFAVFGAAMVVVIALVSTAWVTMWPPTLSVDKTAATTQITPQPPGTPFVPSNLEPSLLTAMSDNTPGASIECFRDIFSTNGAGCLAGSNPDAPMVALFGDSHAAQWYPGLVKLANEGLIRLDTKTKVSCPAASHPQFGYAKCDEWRQAAIDSLNANPPDVILVASSAGRYRPNSTTSTTDVKPDSSWYDSTLATLVKLPKASRVAVLADTPAPGVTPSMCLSVYLDDARKCALPHARTIFPGLRLAEKDAAETAGAAFFDYTDDICNVTSCPSIIGNTLVYRDSNHITDNFSRAMGPTVLADITKLLAQPKKP